MPTQAEFDLLSRELQECKEKLGQSQHENRKLKNNIAGLKVEVKRIKGELSDKEFDLSLTRTRINNDAKSYETSARRLGTSTRLQNRLERIGHEVDETYSDERFKIDLSIVMALQQYTIELLQVPNEKDMDLVGKCRKLCATLLERPSMPAVDERIKDFLHDIRKDPRVKIDRLEAIAASTPDTDTFETIHLPLRAFTIDQLKAEGPQHGTYDLAPELEDDGQDQDLSVSETGQLFGPTALELMYETDIEGFGRGALAAGAPTHAMRELHRKLTKGYVHKDLTSQAMDQELPLGKVYR